MRITAKARTVAEAEKLVAPIEAEVRARLHPSVFATDDETIERVIQTQLMARGWTIGTAESATGGLVAARLTAIPGCLRVLPGVVDHLRSRPQDFLAGGGRSVGRIGERADCLGDGPRSPPGLATSMWRLRWWDRPGRSPSNNRSARS